MTKIVVTIEKTLYKSAKSGIIVTDGRLAQLGERSLDVRKVAGSIPVPSIFFHEKAPIIEGFFIFEERHKVKVTIRVTTYNISKIGGNSFSSERGKASD